ncbi:acetyltransferase [Kosakonia phage Kc263]|uniref:Aminoglycoside-(3)-N-acetyltransferase n=1 Tax=Kosakonia phage Kc263 TaxID=2863194 RepID=A0AAE7WFX8_9CAUD|nr:acetyltransferase [Kosakonia phage Kc263]QYN80145.1 aminoglycoside-(3)-N-acetyltransferase [Kosakonia phage Kc263]
MSLDNVYEQIAGLEAKGGIPEYTIYKRAELKNIPDPLALKVLAEFEGLIAYEQSLKQFEFDKNSSQKPLEKLTDYIQGDSILILATDIENGDLIGTTILRAMVIGNVRIGVLGFVNIAETYRHKGYGTLLMAKVEKVAKGLGCKSTYFAVLPNNIPAVEFYKELGYESTMMYMAKSI